MTALNILMLGGSRRVSMADLLKESGRKLGYEVGIFGYELDKKVPLAVTGKVLQGLKWNDPDIIDDIARVVRENDIRIVLPFVNGAIEIASLCKERIPGIFVPVTDFATASHLFDKCEAARLFKEASIPTPRTYNVLNADMPAIAKPRHGGSSRGIKIFHHLDDLMHLDNLDDYLIQAYIEHNKEYTVDCYVSQSGEILVTVPRERLEIQGGESSRTITCRNSKLIATSREVINHFRLIGPVTLQFLYDLDKDRFLLLEVNPRMGGGVICSVYAGAPIPDYIVSEALGLPVKPCDNWTDNVLMARYSKEAIFYPGHAH